MCLYPTLIKNRKYTANKKNGGVVPPLPDERVKYVAAGCGDCIECRKQKARNWQTRITEECKTNKNGQFVTLTFNTQSLKKLAKEFDKVEGYALDNMIATLAVRRFLERWRKEYTTSVRHWLITELGHGGTEHIHLHGIIWTDESPYKIEQKWGYGYVWKGYERNGKLINYVNASTANYITKYLFKQDKLHRYYKPIILSSNKPGIGHNYINTPKAQYNRYNGANTTETYTTESGHRIGLPTYYRNKLYTDQQREQLWINLLDKQVRYVNGIKIDISKGEENYYKTLHYYQKQNEKMGYGNGTKNWQQEQYEHERRILIYKKRLGH